MPQTFAQRLTLVLPLVGVLLLLISMVLPAQLALFTCGLATVDLLAALTCAILAERESRTASRKV